MSMDPSEIAAVCAVVDRYLSGEETLEVAVQRLVGLVHAPAFWEFLGAHEHELESDSSAFELIRSANNRAEKQRLRALLEAVSDVEMPSLPIVEHLPPIDPSEVATARIVVDRYLTGIEALEAVVPQLAGLLLDPAFRRTYAADHVIRPATNPAEEQRLRTLLDALDDLARPPSPPA